MFSNNLLIVCIVGYYKNGAECTQCDIGKTTDSTGKTQSSDCGKCMLSYSGL